MPVLRLKATDAEDLAVISACLQDALILVDDLQYLTDIERFAFVANRFVWEAGAAPPDGFNRVAAAVTFDGIGAVKRLKLDRRQADGIVSLLAIRPVEGGILLEFSGGGAIRLESAGIDCHLHDVGEPWPTQWRPSHPAD